MSDDDLLGSVLETEFDQQVLHSKPAWVAFAPETTPRASQTRGQRIRGRVKPVKADKHLRKTDKAALDAKDVALDEKDNRRTRKAKARVEQQAEKLAQRPPKDPLPAASESGLLSKLNRESETGPVEHKWRLKRPPPVRFQQLVTQLKFRLGEGNGECFYYVGVHDDGSLVGLCEEDLTASLETLHLMAAEAGARAFMLRALKGGSDRRCAIVRITRAVDCQLSCTDLRIAVAGSMDSGKSTLVAALTHGHTGHPFLDNGHGSARMTVFKHKHEIESGRTSSLSQQLLGYTANGQVLNYSGVASLTPAEITQDAARVLSLIDLGGHERFLKTWLLGMTSMLPAFALLVVCGVHGLGRIGRQHLAVALALEVPVAVAVTKADIAEACDLDMVASEIQDILAAVSRISAAFSGSSSNSSSSDGTPLRASLKTVASLEQARQLAVGMPNNRVSSLMKSSELTLTVPMFHLSSVTGLGLQLLHTFLCALPAGDAASSQSEAAHFQVDETFVVKGTGMVVAGAVVTGRISAGDRLLFGPSAAGRFSTVSISSIHRSRVSVEHVENGQSATLAVKACASATSPTTTTPAAAPAAMDLQPSAPDPSPGSAVPDTAYREPRQSGISVAFQEMHHSESDCSSVDVSRMQGEAAAAAAAASAAADNEDASAAGTPEVEESAWLAERRLLRQHAAVPWLRTRASAAGLAPEVCASQVAGSCTSADGHGYAPRDSRGVSKFSSCSREPTREHHETACNYAAEGPSQQAASHQSRAEPDESSQRRLSDPSATSSQLDARSVTLASDPVCIPSRARSQRGSRGASWHATSSCFDRAGSAPSLLDVSPANSRKGAVLLDPSFQPQAVWEFRALLVLLSGSWPARGLLSGTWPPDSAADVLGDSSSMSDGACQQHRSSKAVLSDRGCSTSREQSCLGALSPEGHQPASPGNACNSAHNAIDNPRPDTANCDPQQHSKAAKTTGSYAAVVHCGSVRQAAHVTAMKEVALDHHSLPVGKIAPAVAASAALHAGHQAAEHTSRHNRGSNSSQLASCAVVVTLRFLHRPEWLQKDAKLILRDRGEGGAAAAGIVLDV